MQKRPSEIGLFSFDLPFDLFRVLRGKALKKLSTKHAKEETKSEKKKVSTIDPDPVSVERTYQGIARALSGVFDAVPASFA